MNLLKYICIFAGLLASVPTDHASSLWLLCKKEYTSTNKTKKCVQQNHKKIVNC